MGTDLAPRNNLLALVEKHEASITDHLPKHISPEKMLRVIRTAIQTTPALWSCTPQSVLESLVDASQLGLEPNGPLGDSALVPFKNNKTRRTECQLMVMYRGYIELGDRTGKIAYFDAQVVHEGDVFEFEYGTEARLRHIPKMDAPKYKEPEGVVAVYGLVKFLNGTSKFVVLSVDEVEEIRACSRAKMGPAWTKWWGEMAKKTALRRLVKYVRLSPELARAAYLDESLDAGLRPGQTIEQAERTRDASDANTESLKQRLEQASADEETPACDDDGVVEDADFIEVTPPPPPDETPNEPEDPPKEFDPIDPMVFGAESKFAQKVNEQRSQFLALAVDSLGLADHEGIHKWNKKVTQLLGSEGCSTMGELDQKGKNSIVKAIAAAIKDFEAALDARQ